MRFRVGICPSKNNLSYSYDTETGLYYLQSRYYNPALGRFINPDAFISTGQGLLGNNMFAYCLNSPVFKEDVMGAASTICNDEDGEIFSSSDIIDRRGAYNGNVSESHSSNVPQKAWKVLNYIKGNNMHPPQNHKGGKTFANDGRDNGHILPNNGITYREYDTDPKIPGTGRGSERIVVGSDGSAWYTPDHYISFIRME